MNLLKNNILIIILLIFVSVFSFSKITSHPADDYEKMKCQKKLKSFDASLKELPLNMVIAEVGKSFMGTPYVAGTLDENPNSEQLTIYITGLDCVTFVENALIFSRLIKSGNTDFDSYKAELELIRYRNGKNTGYASRLHYFTDWIYDNSDELMSEMYDVEGNINSREFYYIPEENISSVYDKLETGDIIGITSSLDGLDIAHTGFVYKEGGNTYLMHASLKNKKVEIYATDIQDYISGNSKQTGIVVARVLEINK